MNKFINEYGFYISLGCLSFIFSVLGNNFVCDFLYCIYFIIVSLITWLPFLYITVKLNKSIF